jgi:hypothetical protein
MTPRKQHATDAGYIAERGNPIIPGKKVVIYIAAEQGIDAWGNKYAVSCDAHSNIGGAASLPKARVFMKRPDEFCLECREALYRIMEDK